MPLLTGLWTARSLGAKQRGKSQPLALGATVVTVVALRPSSHIDGMPGPVGEQQGQQQDEGFIVAVIENRAKEVGFAVFEVANVRLRLFSSWVRSLTCACKHIHALSAGA